MAYEPSSESNKSFENSGAGDKTNRKPFLKKAKVVVFQERGLQL